jgi:hypothetical protein
VSKRVAILQSNYIPWKGYFDLINMVDEFILYDDMQYTRRDWRNRNKIRTREGSAWLTIPVDVKGKFYQTIRETTISEPDWMRKHWATIQHNYGKSPYFNEYRELFEDLYLGATDQYLSNINHRFLTAICGLLGITTKISWSMDYGVIDGKTERLVDLCRKASGTEYISGPAAKDYIVEELFHEAGITLSYMDYSGYPEYPQLFQPFDHYVSIIDLIFNTGPAAREHMKSFAEIERSAT